MGHLHPTNLNCYAIDGIAFWPLIYKNSDFKGPFWPEMSKCTPQTNFLSTPLVSSTTVKLGYNEQLGTDHFCSL